MYLLGMEYAINNDEPKPYGDFAPYVDGIAETRAAQVVAFLEAGDLESFEATVMECFAISELQVEVVQMMRDELVGR